ncbi:MAG: site-2 protease family protein [Clostridia bacterium]|nr:site-2 protease family protein [Clostridia bacterium]
MRGGKKMLLNSIFTLLRGGHVDIVEVMLQVVATLLIIFLVLPFHEYAHGWAANKLGDPTAKWEGRLTFNPLASVEPMGAAALLLFGFGWAKPVPVDSRYFKNPRRDMALVALAGPTANLLASFVGALLMYAVMAFVPYNTFVYYTVVFFNYYSFINAVLAVFNMVPIPPLDGSKILASFLSDRARYNFYRYQSVLSMIGLVLLASSVLDGPISLIENIVYGGVTRLASLPFRLFGLL